ncbi:MAG TPA: ribonuclease D [Thermoanaerobaculia bacterium]|nr:ribonuclease D [Thermoanaerobaculia bacterium]
MSAVAVPVEWIDTHAALTAAAAQWHREPALGLDTEFVRERTFFPQLGIVQVGGHSQAWLIDAVAIGDLTPLLTVLEDARVTKVVHSCSEDMEVLFHRFGEFPRPLFDTQVAAALAGLGPSLSYQRLVHELLGVEIPKGETRSDWLRRPLSPAQVEYAARDVELLLPLHDRLRPQLADEGRADWVLEETARMRDPSRFLPPPEEVYRRLGGTGGMSPRQLAVARALAEWREIEARERDLPRNFVLRESALIQLARRQPATAAELAEVPEVGRGLVKRYARPLLEVIAGALDLPRDRLPVPARRIPSSENVQAAMRRLQEWVAQRAGELGVPAPVLASRRDLRDLALWILEREAGAPPAVLQGWRRQQIGESLLPMAREALRGLR